MISQPLWHLNLLIFGNRFCCFQYKKWDRNNRFCCLKFNFWRLCCACDWNVFVSVLYISMNRIWDGITYFDCCRWRQHYPNTYHLIQKSFHQNITTTSEQCGRCLNPPNKSNMFNPLICTNKSLFVIEIILFITLHNTTNQQTLFNRLLIYAYKYYFKIIII